MSSKSTSWMLPSFVFLIIAGLVGGWFYVTQYGYSDGNGNRVKINLASGETTKVPQNNVIDLNKNKSIPVSVDADLPTDTLDTIATTTLKIKDNYEGVIESNAEQSKTLKLLEEQLKKQNEVNRQLLEKLNAQERKFVSMDKSLAESKKKTLDPAALQGLVNSTLENILPELLPRAESLTNTSEKPVFDIIDAEEEEKFKPVTRKRIHSFGIQFDKNGNVDSKYIDSINNSQDQSSNDSTNNRSIESIRSLATRTTSRSAIQAPSNSKPEVIVDPRFTIPVNSVLNDSVTITALVGRIPKDGDVNDPSPFKVAIGQDNLAANGFTIPGIDRMIMSGFVYGDSVRKCVRTKITKATYIFEDARILTLPKNSSDQSVLGYIADSVTGDPCIQGTYHTNKREVLLKSGIAGVVAAGASAYAGTQVQNTTNSIGGTTSTVTGSTGEFITGRMVSDAANRVADKLQEEQFDQWDQVVVPVGRLVSIHIDTQLEIDQTSEQRKIFYENDTNSYGLTD